MSVENLNDIQDMRPRLRSRLIPMSKDVITTFDMGWLIPHRAEYLVPGDKVNIGHTCLFRFDPFMNPILSRANGKNYDFMIPERILYNETEYDKWFTGGVNESDKDKLKPHLSFKAFYTFCYNVLGSEYGSREGGLFGFNTLCDYLGLPVNRLYVPAIYNPSTGEVVEAAHFVDPDDVQSTKPIALERFLAYALVYREYFLWNHDENSVWAQNPYLSDFTKIPFGNLDFMIDSTDSAYDTDFVEFLTVILTLQRKGWNHDYFTSALPNIQSGDPAIINTGVPDGSIFTITEGRITGAGVLSNPTVNLQRDGYDGNFLKLGNLGTDTSILAGNYNATDGFTIPETFNGSGAEVRNIYFGGSQIDVNPYAGIGSYLKGDFSSVASSGFTINDLRLLNAIQVYKERLNVGGTRLKEALYMQFGVTVPDDRLDRPDFVGFMDFPVQISEVLQTSQTTDDSVLGDQGGHGIGSASQQTVFNYFVLEPMIHLSIMSVLPDTYYMQGLDPFWSKVSRYDVWNPVFNHLSDQAVYNSELYFDPLSDTDSEFGYLPRFAEYKATYNTVNGNLRKIDSGYMSWHQGRLFGARPSLNQTFIDSHPTERIFAVVDEDVEPVVSSNPTQMHTHIIGVINDQMKVARNVPSSSDPSLNID